MLWFWSCMIESNGENSWFSQMIINMQVGEGVAVASTQGYNKNHQKSGDSHTYSIRQVNI